MNRGWHPFTIKVQSEGWIGHCNHDQDIMIGGNSHLGSQDIGCQDIDILGSLYWLDTVGWNIPFKIFILNV